MIYRINPVALGHDRRGQPVFVDEDGRRMWSASTGGSSFNVVREPDPTARPEGNSGGLWNCECPNGIQVGQQRMSPRMCEHVQQTYLIWLDAENRKQQMSSRARTTIEQMREEANQRFELERARAIQEFTEEIARRERELEAQRQREAIADEIRARADRDKYTVPKPTKRKIRLEE